MIWHMPDAVNVIRQVLDWKGYNFHVRKKAGNQCIMEIIIVVSIDGILVQWKIVDTQVSYFLVIIKTVVESCNTN